MSNPQWSPNAPVAPYVVIVDPNGNIQQVGAGGGTTGAVPPSWATTLGAATADNTVTWTLVAQIAPATLPSGVVTLPAPMFVNDADGLDPNLVLNDMISQFQTAAGRTLQPAQVERLLINLYAFRESIVRDLIQQAALQNLVYYAQFPMLDYLGQLVGVARLPAQGATATVQFTLAAAQAIAFTIPAGTLVGTADGQFVFATNAALTIAAGATSGTVVATCTTPGPDANGYAVGQLSVILTPNVLIASASNTTVTSGGGNAETDAHLRARVQAAPNQFSVAGPVGAYRYFALSADPSIIDASVVSPSPGSVNVYVLPGPINAQPAASPNAAGIASSGLLAKVAAACGANTVRPLTDTVSALAVTEVDYAIAGTVTLYSDADPTSTTSAVNAAAIDFAIALASRIQRDIVPEEIIGVLQSVGGVYRAQLSGPAYTQLTAGQWANCTAISLTVTSGSEHS